MKAALLGFQKMEGTSKKTGKPYDGYILHLGYYDEQVTGNATAQIFVDSGIIKNSDCELKTGTTYDFEYEVNFGGFKKLVAVTEC